MIIVEAVNNAYDYVKLSYVTLRYVHYVMFSYLMLNSNEPIKVAHLQKLANQSNKPIKNQSCSPSKISRSISVEWRSYDSEMVKPFLKQEKLL